MSETILTWVVSIGLPVILAIFGWLGAWNKNLNGRLKTIESTLLTNGKDDDNFKDNINKIEPRLKEAENQIIRCEEHDKSMEKQLEKYADSQKETNDRVWSELSKVSQEVKIVTENQVRIETNQEIQIDQMKDLAVQVSKLVVSMEKNK